MNPLRRLVGNRYARRLGVMVATLVLVDRFVPRVLERAERDRYETGRLTRFENSDLFALGPLVEYLREHPKGSGPRMVFLGDSVVWGYWIRADQALPAQFQQLVPQERVFNLGINGFGTSSDYLIAKSIVKSVDSFVLFDLNQAANPLLPELIPIVETDLRLYQLAPPDRLETELRRRVGVWQLYRYSYRLQAAWMGMSTRSYVYLNKGELARAPVRVLRGQPASRPPAAAAAGPVATGVVLTVPPAVPPPSDERAQVLAATYPSQWRFAHLVQTYDKEAIVVELDGHSAVENDHDLAELNARFNPAVHFVRLSVPRELRPDSTHFSPEGARAVAQALLDYRTAARTKR